MTRKILCIVAFIISVSNISSAQEKILKLPMTIEQGYGPFKGGFGSISKTDTNNTQNPWHKTYVQISGIPQSWKNHFYGYLWLDAYQFVYQNYKKGNITEERYIELQKDWKWTPDEKALSANPIKCYVHCAWNIDENGHMGEAIIDANNNLDFSDDTIFNAPILKDFKYNDAIKNPKYFKAQQFKNGKVTDITVPLALTLSPPYVFYTIPIYGKAVLNQGKSSYKFAVTSSNFARTDFTNTQMHLVKRFKKKVDVYDLPINQGEFITLGDKTYKYKGVDLQEMTFNLEEVNNSGPLYSAQTGYYAFPFRDKEVTTGIEISLEKYKGKYVFIDFWGTWCKPCVEEIPNVKKAYEALDKDKIAFISIAYDSPERIKEFITKEQIEWPQIVNGETNNKIITTYNINSYPTTLLIDPSGKIIAKNIRGEDLDKKLAKLIN